MITGSDQGTTSENGTGFASSITSAGSYVKPTQFTISADLQPSQNVGQPAPTTNNLALGFFKNPIAFTVNTSPSNVNGTPGTGNYSNFTGLQFDSNGGLSLIVNGTQSGSTIAFGGTYTPNVGLNTLSYNVNTTTGAISNISLSGSTADYSAFDSTAAFTDAATAYAGVYSEGSQNQNGSLTDNFLLSGTSSPVPEPATLSLIGLGALGLLHRRPRRD